MTTRRLTEDTVLMLRDYIKDNIASALSEVRSFRTDGRVSTEVPKEYFLYAEPQAYRVPAVFIICNNMSMENAANGSNSILGLADIVVSCLVEDRNRTLLQYRTWRYQSALHKLLHLTQLTNDDNSVKLIIKVESILFSPEFSRSKNDGSPDSVFRKEVALQLEVEHYEQLG